MSPSRLEARIATLRNRVRRLLALRGLGWLVGLLVPVVILLGLADWAIHLDAVVRAAALLGLAGFAVWLFWQYVLTPLIIRFVDLDIALKIEERWPGLNDRLASTVQFLHLAGSGDDDRFGSEALCAATVQQTIEETKSIDFRQVIEPRPVLNALALAAGSLLIAGAIGLAAPELSTIAVRRLFLPFGPDRWPQQTHLTVIDGETPLKVARGDTFTLGVQIAKGERMPASARATYRFEDGETETESLRAVEGGIFRGRIESVSRPFTFSVAAGDDSTSIRNRAVKVVPPPALKDLTVRLFAPPYTGVEPQTMAPGRTQIRAVVGTRIEIDAQANKPIARAELHLGEKISGEPVVFDSARTGLKAHFTLFESAPFWFELRDTDGFRNRELIRNEVRAFADAAPQVTIEDPPHDRDVPAKALVPVVFSAVDDFGLQSARLLYKIATAGSEPAPEVALPLWAAPMALDRSPGTTAIVATGPVKQQEVRYAWNLEPLNLAPGAIITFHAEARDFDNLKGPNVGKSREIRLRILSNEDILREQDDARREIRDETARILAMQKQALTPVQDALRTMAQTEKTDAVNRDELKNAAMIQRQVGSRITSQSDGLEQKLRRFLEDLKNFKIPNPDAQKQMEQMQASVEQIRQQNLGPAEQGLTRATKNLEGNQNQNQDQNASPPRDQTASQGEPKPTNEAAPEPPNEGAPKPARKAAPKGAASETPKGKASNGQASQPDKQPSGKPADGTDRPAPPSGTPESTPSKPAEATELALKEAESNQKAIADELQKMLDGLSEFETYRGVVKDAQNLLKEQVEAMKKTAEVAGKQEMSKTRDALNDEQKADLDNLAARQNNLGKDLQNLQAKMDDMAKRLEESDPLAASAMSDAAQESRKKGTAAKMNEAADQLKENQTSKAGAGQKQVQQELKDLVDSLQNRRERELSRLVKELKNAEAEMNKLRQRQAENLKKTQEARNNPDAKQRADQLKKLAKEQAEIKKELEKQLKKLAKLNAGDATKAGQKASGQMSKAEQDLDQDEGEKAEQDEDEALADLEEAQDEIQQARRDAEEQLAMEQLVKMADQLKAVSGRQDNIVKETEKYEKLRTERTGPLTIGQRNSIRGLGREEDGLKEETGELVEKLEGAQVFALTLKRASENMGEAAQRLQTLKTDEDTQRAVKSAAKRFQQLLESLKPDKPKPGDQPPGGGNQGGGGGAGGGGDGIPAAAQVKMLKALQEEINERTEYFDELRRRKKELTAEQNAEFERLQVDQGTLADLARDLTRPKKADGED